MLALSRVSMLYLESAYRNAVDSGEYGATADDSLSSFYE